MPPVHGYRFVSHAKFRLRSKESLSASEAAKRARNELEDAEDKAQQALVRLCGYL